MTLWTELRSRARLGATHIWSKAPAFLANVLGSSSIIYSSQIISVASYKYCISLTRAMPYVHLFTWQCNPQFTLIVQSLHRKALEWEQREQPQHLCLQFTWIKCVTGTWNKDLSWEQLTQTSRNCFKHFFFLQCPGPQGHTHACTCTLCRFLPFNPGKVGEMGRPFFIFSQKKKLTELFGISIHLWIHLFRLHISLNHPCQ